MAISDWDRSAEAWIASIGENGDWTREHVLDPAMLARLDMRKFSNALDIGCGEGRFCRILAERGIVTTGIDPTARLIEEARKRDPQGIYLEMGAEALAFADGSFDLVVSYLSLIDIADYKSVIAEMARVLAPSGTLLIANLNGFATVPTLDDNYNRWHRSDAGERLHYRFDKYMDEAVNHESWRGIQIVNHHRPLSAYFKALLGQGLELTHFDEPEPVSGDPLKVSNYRRMPHALVMEWRKPSA